MSQIISLLSSSAVEKGSKVRRDRSGCFARTKLIEKYHETADKKSCNYWGHEPVNNDCLPLSSRITDLLTIVGPAVITDPGSF